MLTSRLITWRASRRSWESESSMPEMNAQNMETLRAAIAWALELVDSHEQSLIAAYLADALNIADKLTDRDTA